MTNAIEIRGLKWRPGKTFAMRWLRTYLDPSPRGPGVPLQSTLFTILTLGIMAGGAVRMGRR